MRLVLKAASLAILLCAYPVQAMPPTLLMSFDQGVHKVVEETQIIFPYSTQSDLNMMRNCKKLSLKISGIRAFSELTPNVRIFLNHQTGTENITTNADNYVGELNFYGHRREQKGSVDTSFFIEKAVGKLDTAGRLTLPISITLIPNRRVNLDFDSPRIGTISLWCLEQ